MSERELDDLERYLRSPDHDIRDPEGSEVIVYQCRIIAAADAITALRARARARVAQQQRVIEMVSKWVAASDKFEKSVDVYNARAMFCRAHELGLYNVDTEYRLMEAARRERDATIGPMLFAARAALAALDKEEGK